MKDPTDITGTDTTTVGVLLPLSGSKSSRGQEVLQGIESAFYREKPEDIQLMVRDTEGTPPVAREKLRTLQFTNAILGPLFSDELKALQDVVGKDQVLISFSNDIAQARNRAILFGHNPVDEMQFILQTAYDTGQRRFAALLPDNEYGKRLEKAFTQHVEYLGAEMVRVSYYSPNNYDVYGAVAPLRDAAIDGILVPEGGKRLEALAREIRRNKISGRILGLSLWEDNLPKTVRLKGSWYASPLSPNKRWFRNYFQQLYGTTPSRQAQLGFDAMSLLLTLRKRHKYDPFEWRNFTITQGFQGAAGEFVIQEDGQVNRKISILEITSTSPVVVSDQQD